MTIIRKPYAYSPPLPKRRWPGTRALSAYAALILSDGPEAYYRLSDTSASFIEDWISDHDGAVVSVEYTLATSSLIYNDSDASITFSGGGHVQVPSSRWFSIGTGEFTAECWVKFTAQAGSQTFCSKIDALFGVPGWILRYQGDSGGRIVFEIDDGTEHAGIVSANTYNVGDGRIHHVAGVRTTSNVFLYLDGVNVANTSSAVSGSIDNSVPFEIGAFSSTPNDFFIGAVDEVAVYKRALSPAEIDEHWLAGKTPFAILNQRRELRAIPHLDTDTWRTRSWR